MNTIEVIIGVIAISVVISFLTTALLIWHGHRNNAKTLQKAKSRKTDSLDKIQNWYDAKMAQLLSFFSVGLIFVALVFAFFNLLQRSDYSRLEQENEKQNKKINDLKEEIFSFQKKAERAHNLMRSDMHARFSIYGPRFGGDFSMQMMYLIRAGEYEDAETMIRGFLDAFGKYSEEERMKSLPQMELIYILHSDILSDIALKKKSLLKTLEDWNRLIGEYKRKQLELDSKKMQDNPEMFSLPL